MTTAPDPLDLRAKALHASALANVSAPVLARLRQARHAAASAPVHAAPRLPAWLAGGGALAAALVLAIVLWPQPAPPGTTPAAALATTEVAAPLQEDPGFYLWLASADAPLLALE